MEIIAKTSGGFIINASTEEVKEILKAVNGNLPDKLDIGQKIPAIDYASTIRKVQTLSDSYEYTQLVSAVNNISSCLKQVQASIEAAKNINP